jgi:two-component system response regulator NreC
MVRAATQILIVDDHVLVRSTMADRLARERGFNVVATTGSPSEVFELVYRLHPDLVLMDIDLDGTESLPLTRQVIQRIPQSRVILVSALIYDRYVDFALENGVRGYVCKDESIDTLIRAVRAVQRGELFYSDRVRARLVPKRKSADCDEVRSRSASLTDRQREILRQIAQGRSKSEVAANLQVSVKTVETHCEMMMRRLLVNNRVDLARLAIRENMAD